MNISALKKRFEVFKSDSILDWAKGLRIYYIYLPNAAIKGKDANRLPNFEEAKLVIDHAKALGFNAVFFMPLCALASDDPSKHDSPYSLLSFYALDRRFVTIPVKGENIIAKWHNFDKPADFIAFSHRSWVKQYARTEALNILKNNMGIYPLELP